MVNKTVKLLIPLTPNFVFDENKNQYSIDMLTESEIKQIGAEWTENLLQKGTHLRNVKKP